METPRKGLADRLPPKVRPFTTAVLHACQRMALAEKELADRLRLSPAQWSKQKSGVEGHRIHVQRFDELPEAELNLFLDAMLDELAKLRGRVVVTPAGQLAAIVRSMRSMADAAEQSLLGTSLHGA